jgi:hypothetical protein
MAYWSMSVMSSLHSSCCGGVQPDSPIARERGASVRSLEISKEDDIASAYVTKGTLIMTRIVLAVITAVALAGCANSEAAKRAAAQAAFQAEIKADDAECQSYGAKPDSDAYVQCRLAIDVRKANSEATAETARQQARTRP